MSVKLEYNFRKTYTPATSISNELTTGTSFNIDGASSATTTISNKKFIGDTAAICTILAGASAKTVIFENCLFVNCTKVFYSANNNFTKLQFKKCVFYNCLYVADTGTAAASSGIEITSSIIWKTPFFYTAINITFTNAKPSSFQQFVGYTGTLTQNDSINKWPRWLSTDSSDIPATGNADGIGFVLMSKSRGYDYDSPCLVGTGTDDAGVWTETRAAGVDANDSWTLTFAPEESKNITLVGLSSFTDVNGVARAVHQDEKKYIKLTLSGLDDADIDKLKDLFTAKDNQVKIYPDSTVSTRYVTARLLKDKALEYKKQRNGYFDDGKIPDAWWESVLLNFIVDSETGADWQ